MYISKHESKKLTMSHRWAFLESGVEQIMRNLKDGMDLATVRWDDDISGLIRLTFC